MVTQWYVQLWYRLQRRLHRASEEGQGLVEYALILAFVTIVILFAVKFLQPQISNTLNNVANNM